MAENLVSSVFEKLGSIIRQDGLRIKGSKEVQELLDKFTTIHEALYEAEAKFGLMGWKDWFCSLKQLVYDIEDLTDKRIVEALIFQIEAIYDEHQQWNRIDRTGGKVRKFFLPCLHFEKFRYVFKIRALRKRLDTITRDKDHFDRSLEMGNQQTSSEQIEIFGRDGYIDNIITKLLLNEESEPAVLPGISIYGERGIGKTTLAQLAFNDERVRSHFDTRMWVSVSYTGFDVRSIAESIIKSATAGTSYQLSDLDQLQSLLGIQQAVNGKRFLLVLDDLEFRGAKNYWIKLIHATLQCGAKGSRILVTTPNYRSTYNKFTSHYVDLWPLNKDACWSLFCSIAFSKRSREPNLDSESIKWEIFKISRGIPTLVKVFGHVLGLVDTASVTWQSVLQCAIWNSYDFGMFSTLESSYFRLPSHLMRCLKYCSVFPKGCWAETKVLIQLWMAEGFIHSGDESRDMEEIGMEYFNVLTFRTSFFNEIEKDEDGCIVRCKMNEKFYDFVQYHAKWGCSLIEVGQFPSTARHSSLLCNENTTFIPNPLIDVNNMRTFLCLGNPRKLKVPHDFFSCFKQIRALDLSSTEISELPKSVGALKYLRYLNLCYTRIKKLPESLCGLCFLQTLKLSCSQLHELPKGTRKLINLWHLEIDGTPMNCLPYGIERLTRLRKLSTFIIGSETGCRIGELENLNLLRGSLIISNLDRLINEDEAAGANLSSKDQLDCLVLDGKKHFNLESLDRQRHFGFLILEHMYKEDIEFNLSNGTDMKRVQGVFEGIKPHANLRKLEIWNYIGHKFPEWINEPSLTNLVSLRLVKCVNVKYLPSLGKLPSLKYLLIRGMVEVEQIDHRFYGDGEVKGFSKLEHFVLNGMSSWKVWDLSVEEGEMPCLTELVLSNCPKLKTLPRLPNTLRKLEIYNCDALSHNQSFPPVKHFVLKGKDRMLSSLPNIPKLMSLKITLSSELTMFPNGLGQFNRLETLTIHFCPKLEYLPQELQHIATLEKLHIVGCPLLKEKLLKDRSEEWRKIAHVRKIVIDNKEVHKKDANSMLVSLNQSHATTSYAQATWGHGRRLN